MIEFIREGYRGFDAAHGIGPAEWPHHDLFFVHRGEVELEFPGLGRTLTISRGSGVLIWPQTGFHGRARGQGARASIQHFRVMTGATAPYNQLIGQHGGLSTQNAPASPWIEQCVNRAQQLARSPSHSQETGLAQRLLLALVLTEGQYVEAGADGKQVRRIDLFELERWLRANLDQKPGVAEMAKQAGLSPSRFRTVFREEHGRTVGNFLLAVREAEGRRRLVETHEPIKGIAHALGYADAVVFHRTFKRSTGLTPTVYRRQHRIFG